MSKNYIGFDRDGSAGGYSEIQFVQTPGKTIQPYTTEPTVTVTQQPPIIRASLPSADAKFVAKAGKQKKRIKKLKQRIKDLKKEIRSVYFNSHQTHVELSELRKKLKAK